MIIAVTGTPGTGKTSVARELSELLDCRYVDVNQVAEREEVETEQDGERGTLAVETGSLVEALEQELEGVEDAVLDGHLSHRFPADLTVVLRCEPSELEERLEDKGWGEEKIWENVEAEALDLILQEAVHGGEEVMEVDTTGREAVEVAEELQEVVEAGEIPESLRPGTVEWGGERLEPG